jgi:hypothetical protein
VLLQNAFAQVLVSPGNKVPQIVLINKNYLALLS